MALGQSHNYIVMALRQSPSRRCLTCENIKVCKTRRPIRPILYSYYLYSYYHIVMAYIAMAYIVMAYIAMAYKDIVMAHI